VPTPKYTMLGNSSERIIMEIENKSRKKSVAAIEDPPEPIEQLDGAKEEEVKDEFDVCDVCGIHHPIMMQDPMSDQIQIICPDCMKTPPCELRGRYTDPHQVYECAKGCINRYHLYRKRNA